MLLDDHVGPYTYKLPDFRPVSLGTRWLIAASGGLAHKGLDARRRVSPWEPTVALDIAGAGAVLGKTHTDGL